MASEVAQNVNHQGIRHAQNPGDDYEIQSGMVTTTPDLNYVNMIHRTDNNNGNSFSMDPVSDPNQENEDLSSSSYTLASEQSQFSNALDNWIRGVPAITAVNTANTDAQGNIRPPQGHHSTQPEENDFSNSGIWYILAMILPLISFNNNTRIWGCSASTVIHAAEMLATQLNYFLRCIRGYLQRLAHDQVARDVFATAMDVVLIIYAMGFLVLSMYQASIFS